MHDFIQPWWSNANHDPRGAFSRTFKYIDTAWSNNKVDKKFRKSQIMKGINAGFEEMLKMSKSWFKVPLVYLVLMDIRRAPGFMRAINRLLCHVKVISREECNE